MLPSYGTCELWGCVVNLCTGKTWRSSGTRIGIALLGNSNMDAKRWLVLLAFYVGMSHYYFVFKCYMAEQETRRWRWQFISKLTTCLHLQLSDKFDLWHCEYDQRGVLIWSLLVNTVNETPFEGTISCSLSSKIILWTLNRMNSRTAKIHTACSELKMVSINGNRTE